MGFVTPLVINNDSFHELSKNPGKFLKDISTAMNDGQRIHGAQVHMAVHSSIFQLFALQDKVLVPIDIYHKDFKQYANRNPDELLKLLEKSKVQLDEAITHLKLYH